MNALPARLAYPTGFGPQRAQFRMPSFRVAAGLAAAAIGGIALLGWFLGNDLLKSVIPGTLTMKANTAACLILMGIGLTLLDDGGRRLRSHAGQALFATATAVAAMTASEFILGVDLGIDQALFREAAGQTGTMVPGRMAPATIICFVSLGIAALSAHRPRAVTGLCGVALALPFLNMLDLAFDATTPTFLAGSTQMALNTAVGSAIVACGLLARLGPASPFGPLTVGTTTAKVFRRLLVVSIVTPLAMAWLRLEGQRLGLYGTTYGTSLMVVGVVGVIVAAILYSAGRAVDLEAKRLASELERDRFFELSVDLLAVVTADGHFRRVNPAWMSVLGYEASDMVGRSVVDFLHPDDLERSVADPEAHAAGGEQRSSYENRYRHHDGTYRWLEWTSQRAPDQSVAFAVARDITDRKHQEDRRERQQRALRARNVTLRETATRDPLTGLHNRRHFDAQLGRDERRNAAVGDGEGRVASVILFDLDHFGQVNKQHGHQAGDAVLRAFGALLSRRFRATDLVARYGGEEFVAVLEGASAERAGSVAESVRASFEDLRIDAGPAGVLQATVSAGFAEVGSDGVAGALAVADVWLSQAKRGGRNQVIGLG